MDIDVIFKIAGIGILVTVVNQVLSKNGRDDMAVMVNLAGIVIVLLIVIDMISELFGVVRSVFNLY
ncbi:MAG: stage III sporulation protein AC [Anaerofustis stercorihominis]|nr:stage III sporulation protein AC [Anaerofustis stercorihominis]